MVSSAKFAVPAFHMSMFRYECGKPAERCGLPRDAPGAVIAKADVKTKVDTATLGVHSENAVSSLILKLQNISYGYNSCHDHLHIPKVVIRNEMTSHAHYFTLSTRGELLHVLTQMHFAGSSAGKVKQCRMWALKCPKPALRCSDW